MSPRHATRSPSSSPARKRQRLSSPTYDGLLPELSQEDLKAFDALDACLSQDARAVQGGEGNNNTWDLEDDQTRSSGYPTSSPPLVSLADERTVAPDFHDNLNPFSLGAGVSSKSPAPPTGFSSALHILDRDSQDHSQTLLGDEPCVEPDYDAWFNPAPVDAPIAFTTARFSAASASVVSNTSKIEVTKVAILEPSAAALAEARRKLAKIWSEEQTEPNDTAEPPENITFVGFKTASSAASPLINHLTENSSTNYPTSPSTPSPVSFSRPLGSLGLPPVSPLSNKTNKSLMPKPFKSPLMTKAKILAANPAKPVYTGSPLNPRRSVWTPVPLQPPTTSLITPSTPRKTSSNSEATDTPKRIANSSNRFRGRTPAHFVTPFKPGMQPGQPGRKKLEESLSPSLTKHVAPVVPSKRDEVNRLTSDRPQSKSGIVNRKGFPDRKTLSSSGLLPQQHDAGTLISMGINAPEILQMTPNLATHYSFHLSSSVPQSTKSSTLSTRLGSSNALQELLDRGCTLASQPWVDNHWCLILWKLAGMTALDPEREADIERRRWCWPEVMRQLLYRYERELNGGNRPALRLITTRDAPAAFPMVLCVSGMIWHDGGVSDDGAPIEAYPELEVTDGWYRLRAQVDPPMARAIRKGTIRVGRKIGVAGAWLSSEKKDPMEVLEAYNSTKLVLSGNSSHLAPWHSKLGFRQGPFISTLHSLSANGGTVAAMDLIIIKTYPIAFIENIEDEDGNKISEGPRNEADEAKVNEQWIKRREVEANKLRIEFEKKISRFEGYIERLERRAGSAFRPTEHEYPPDNIDSLYDELEDPAEAVALITRLTATDAGWLAQHIRQRLETEKEKYGETIEQELQIACPPRNVRSFRILIVKDGNTCRRPANRHAKLTVWDVMNLSLSEGSAPGSFQVGHRYLVTNIFPTHQKSWMGFEPDSEVYLCTKRQTRWTKIRP